MREANSTVPSYTGKRRTSTEAGVLGVLICGLVYGSKFLLGIVRYIFDELYQNVCMVCCSDTYKSGTASIILLLNHIVYSFIYS